MDDAFETLASTSLVAQARDRIQRAISRGELLPGQRLVEGEIAQKLGISRGPVREAARLLEQRGLLLSLPRRGFFVRKFEAREIEELYELREWIEVAAVRAAAECASAADLETLARQHARLLATAQRPEEDELIDAIVDFHRSVCALAGNTRLLRLFDEIGVEIRQVLSVLGVEVDDLGRPVEAQTSLLRALENRDGELAADEMRRFINKARQEVLEHYARRHADGVATTEGGDQPPA